MFQTIWYYKKRIILLVSIAALLVLYVLGLYPVAIVNGHSITEKRFHSASAAAQYYYDTMVKMYNQAKKDPNPKSVNQTELQSATLTGLIENELIAEKLQADLGNELQYLLNEKLSAAGDSPGLRKTVATLYGMNWEDFKREILVPQAMKDILSDQSFLKKENADAWLDQAERSANVILFSLKFSWNGSKVMAKQ